MFDTMYWKLFRLFRSFSSLKAAARYSSPRPLCPSASNIPLRLLVVVVGMQYSRDLRVPPPPSSSLISTMSVHNVCFHIIITCIICVVCAVHASVCAPSSMALFCSPRTQFSSVTPSIVSFWLSIQFIGLYCWNNFLSNYVRLHVPVLMLPPFFLLLSHFIIK